MKFSPDCGLKLKEQVEDKKLRNAIVGLLIGIIKSQILLN